MQRLNLNITPTITEPLILNQTLTLVLTPNFNINPITQHNTYSNPNYDPHINSIPSNLTQTQNLTITQPLY